MELTCPVCGEPQPESVARCAKCGFPRALTRRLRGPVAFIPPETTDTLPASGPAARPRPPPVETGPEAELNAAIAHRLGDRMTLLRTIDTDPPDVTAEMCEAALNEASGRVGDAQQILRSAQSRLDRETEELLGRHLADLESRGKALDASGLHVALEDPLARVAETILAGEPAAGVAALEAAERKLRRVEEHWRGLETLFAQVTTLREEAKRLGISLEGEPDRLAAVRSNLATMPATENDLDVAARVASDALMRLHELIPPALEQELTQHDAAIEAAPADLPRAGSARRLHSDAVRHMSEGRLMDAVQSVQELRTVLAELTTEAAEAARRAVAEAPPEPSGPEPTRPAGATDEATHRRAEPTAAAASQRPRSAAEPSRPEPTGPVPGPVLAEPAPAPPVTEAPNAGELELAELMQKARDLAARVRALPPESKEAKATTRQLKEATRHLRARQLREARAMLDVHPSGTSEPPEPVPLPSAARPTEVESTLPPPAPVVAATASGVGESDEPELEALAAKARNLALRVRALAPDSEEARSASSQIHEATELLRAHRLAEADAALTRIMDALALEP